MHRLVQFLGRDSGYHLGIDANSKVYIKGKRSTPFNPAARELVDQLLKDDKDVKLNCRMRDSITVGAEVGETGIHEIDMADIRYGNNLPSESAPFGSAWMMHEIAEAMAESKGFPFRRSRGVGGAHGEGIKWETEFLRQAGYPALRRNPGVGPQMGVEGRNAVYKFDYGSRTVNVPKRPLITP